MSGPELILGILPLLISAAEHWDDCIRPFKRYRKFTTEVDRFQRRLKVQNAIFRNQCRILLENVTQDEAAEQMLAEPKHPSWTDPEIEDRLAVHLAASRDACLTTIELIEEKLEEVQAESQDLGAIVTQDQGIATQDHKTWRRRVATKLRFSFSKSRLDENLATLRSLNDDFRTLSSQTTKPHTEASVPTHNIKKEVQICRTIGKASRQVYEALGKACTKHTEHLAHFDLKVEHRPCQGVAIPDLKFKMAFTHLTLAGMGQGEPMWFVVDSIIEGSDTPRQLDNNVPGLDQLTGSLKRQCSASQGPTKKQSKKRVRFQTPTPPPMASVMSVHVPTALLSMPSIRKDFCDYLRKYMGQQNYKSETPMAVLEVTEGCKHLVYPSPCTLARTNKHAVSLQQYISSLPKNQGLCATFAQYERLRLAKALATAVLQYHGTPWLKLTWRSEDVVFFGQQADDSNDSILDLAVPHLNVKVRGPDGQNPQTTCISRNLAPNSVLFGLGVVLLEIAYSATLKSLQQPSDLCNGVDTSFSEFFTAKRLASSIGREMGSSYGKVVKKLLQCDFGCGDDLNEPDLQAGYYKDVVCELDRLEQGFRQLQLGS